MNHLGIGVNRSGAESRVPGRGSCHDGSACVRTAASRNPRHHRWTFSDGVTGQDAVYNSVDNSLEALQVSSGYFGYERAWRPTFTSAFTYGIVNVQNLDIQPDDALQRTQRTTVNLTWTPIPQADIVIEFLTGVRVNKDGESGASSQIQTGFTFRF